MVADTGIETLDARKQSEVNKANESVIFINGGPERLNLIENINKNIKLLELIKKAKNIVTESSGSIAMGEYMRSSRSDSKMVKAIGVLKDVVIEPHYTERNYKQYLPEDMTISGVKYGIGIDSATGIIITPQDFPNKWEKVGPGNVYIIKA